MSMLLRRGIIQSLGGALNVADVFSTDLWSGNASTRDIVNGLDATSSDMMVWIKSRSLSRANNLFDSVRGATKFLVTNDDRAETTSATTLTSFNSDGYSLSSSNDVNGGGATYAGWSFLKAKKFLDIIEYTGDGVAGHEIPHDLGVQAGFVIVKRYNTTDLWLCQHVSIGGTKHLVISNNASEFIGSTQWDSTTATDSVVTLGSNIQVNANGGNYIMYVFAHDPSADGVIQCSSYTGNGSSTGPEINLGWRPQYVMVKSATINGDWHIMDVERGFSSGGSPSPTLESNNDRAELANVWVETTATGFKLVTASGAINASGEDYVYMAIREEE